MQIIRLFTLLVLICSTFQARSQSQGYAFGIKGGLTVGSQQWNGLDRDLLFRYHGIAFIESITESNEFGLFAQAGYHVKGSAIRTPSYSFVNNNGNEVNISARETAFEFNNLSLTIGAKQRFPFLAESFRGYYAFGIRGDYTVSTDFDRELDPEDAFLLSIYPAEEFVEKINYGAYLGIGMEASLGELSSAILEFSVNPDFSRQYRQPAIENVINPNPNSSQRLTDIPEREITNLTFELTLGLRFLNKYVYVD